MKRYPAHLMDEVSQFDLTNHNSNAQSETLAGTKNAS